MGDAARAAGVGSGCAAPIIVDGRLWGQMCVFSSRGTVLPAGTEHQLDDFVKLVATAISNYDARGNLRTVADEQAALRRVATLVARGTPSDALFAAVCEEVEALAGADASAVVRFETDATVTVMGDHAALHQVGARVKLDPDYIVAEVHRTGEAARFDTDDPAAPGMPTLVQAERIHSALASPIVVEGELWGAITTFSRVRPLAAGMERRLADFTELVATAISNLHARAELAASRARIAAAADDERRRVVRDLHDGAQQRLVHTVVTLKLAQRALERDAADAASLLGEALEQAQRATHELRELVHGILPAALTAGGLRAGVDALASRMPLPVAVDVCADRFPPESRRPPTSSSRRRSPTSPSTHTPRPPRSPHGSRTGHSGSRSATTASGALARTGAAFKASRIGWPRSTGGSRSSALPPAEPWSQRPSPSRRAPDHRGPNRARRATSRHHALSRAGTGSVPPEDCRQPADRSPSSHDRGFVLRHLPAVRTIGDAGAARQPRGRSDVHR